MFHFTLSGSSDITGCQCLLSYLLFCLLHNFFFNCRWECRMICTISFTICGLKTSLLVSFLDKHTPWISGRPAYLLLNLHPIITRKTTLTQPTNYHAAEKITKKITKPSLKFELSLEFKAEFQHQQPGKN